MNELNINYNYQSLKHILNEWFNELIEQGKIKPGDHVNNISRANDRLYELSSKNSGHKSIVGFVILDKYEPGDGRIVHIYQDLCIASMIRSSTPNTNYIIEDGEIRNNHGDNMLAYDSDWMKVLRNRLIDAFGLKNRCIPNEKHRILDHIRVEGYWKDVIDNCVDFMVKQIMRSEDIIFQSGFGFMDNDIPFTMHVIRRTTVDPDTNEEQVNVLINGWNQDWCSFIIEDTSWIGDTRYCGDWRIMNEFIPHRLNYNPEWENMDAYEIIMNENFTDVNYRMSGNPPTALVKPEAVEGYIRANITNMLTKTYIGDPETYEEDDYYHDSVEGIIAVIYKK